MNQRTLYVATSMLALLLASGSAHAFRCGQKLVREDMHEAEVRKVCGAPTTQRQIGWTTRGQVLPIQSNPGGGWQIERYPGYGQFVEQVLVTEYVYNFGPRKFMRRLLFEGGILVRIETIGYGYNEEK